MMMIQCLVSCLVLKCALAGVEMHVYFVYCYKLSECVQRHASRMTFRTPGFPEKQVFLSKCLGSIKGPPGSTIRLRFFNGNFTKFENCSGDHLYVSMSYICAESGSVLATHLIKNVTLNFWRDFFSVISFCSE